MEDRQFLSKKIIEQQSILNKQTIQHQQKQYHNPCKIVQFGGILEPDPSNLSLILPSFPSPKKDNSYAKILQNQINLHQLDGENQRSRCRLVDQQNQLIYRKQYPYGKENVKITEEVIKKYSANHYLAQKNAIQKFEEEADEYRKSRVRKKLNQSHLNTNSNQIHSASQINFSNKPHANVSIKWQQRQSQPRTYQNQISLVEVNPLALEQEECKRRQKQKNKEKQVLLKQREKQAMINVTNLLREIQHKVQVNAGRMTEELQVLKDQLKKPIKRHSDAALQKMLRREQDEKINRLRIPIVVYKNTAFDARVYYNQENDLERIEKENVQSSSEDYQKVLRILEKNSKRLNFLTQQ